MKNKRLVSIDYLRFIAVMMILYDHLGGMRNATWIVKRGVDAMITTPLYIIQDFGGFGVSLFFIISGFLFSYYARYDCIVKKTGKKVLKIYVASLLAFVAFALLQILVWQITPTYWSQFSINQWIKSSTLVGFFSGEGEVINGTTWFLLPLFLFYIYSIIYALIMSKRINHGMAVFQLVVVASYIFLNMVVFNGREFLVYAIMPIAGMVMGELYKKDSEVSFFEGIICLIIDYVILVFSIRNIVPQYYVDSPYIISFVYAVGLFSICLLFEEKFKENVFVSYICEKSLSIYLLQMTFGSFFMSFFGSCNLPFTICFVFTIILVVVISHFHDLLIKKVF